MKMTKSLVEFKRFSNKVALTLSDDEKKLTNLILGAFEEIAAVGTAVGRRGKVLAKLIVEKGATASPELEISADVSDANGGEIIKLTKLEVENFRGFTDKQTFEFKNRYTFIYGPNGTGKSSLCEALEYGLRASINEADSKRIPVLEYIKNATSGKSVMPVLYGDTAGEKGIKVKADSSSFEFCFIEKNRIDGFARLAANTPANQQARLAALFGLEDFNMFTTQFNESLDTYFAELVGKKGRDLAEREKVLAGQKAILADLPEKAKNTETRCATLLTKYPDYKDLAEIKVALIGAEGNGGKLKENNTEIGRLRNLKLATDPGMGGILAAADSLLGHIEEKAKLEESLKQYKDQLSIRYLYAALLSNREKFRDVCPACASELYKDGRLVVPVDPYINAEEKLKDFDAALSLEGRINETQDSINRDWRALLSTIAKLPAAASAVGFTEAAEIDLFSGKATDDKDVAGIETFLRALLGKCELLLALKDAISNHNSMVEQSEAATSKLENDNHACNYDLAEIVAISTLVAANEASEKEATEAIEKFNDENENLISEAESEKPAVVRSLSYSVAYKSLREKLVAYNAELLSALATDLNEKTLNFYNEINKHDPESDKLKSLRLPRAAGEKIEINFEEGNTCDALQVLSEGHIRCLGLAILLAKITKDSLPFLIFDDVVNSIDDERRSAIIDLILDPEKVGNRQLIVTTHGEDFVKRLENAIPQGVYRETVTRIDFLTPLASKKIAVKLDSPRHYLVVATQSYKEGRVRDSLSYIRKAFEEQLNRLWKKISKRNLSAQISVSMRGPGAPDLMSVASGLHQFLSKQDVTIFQEAIPHLEAILGYRAKHRIEWNNLNQGTHEGELTEEFDVVIVKCMLEAVTRLDQAIEASQV